MTSPTPWLVVTTINPPNDAMRTLADGSIDKGWNFVVIGDTKSPDTFDLPGSRFYSVDDQVGTGLAYAKECPTRHYCRKNIGYLLAAQSGATHLVETDDDNIPLSSFFDLEAFTTDAPRSTGAGWCNVYRYFDGGASWPRGLPLDAVQADTKWMDAADADKGEARTPIIQYLADDNPDVDAIYRLVHQLPMTFAQGRKIAMGSGSWCPFNSQATVWEPRAFPLLYLPAYCSFRMTDIWRSFVAQRVAWAQGWSVLFASPRVRQERNEHDLMRDFADEVPGYLHNRAIAETLDAVEIEPGAESMPKAVRDCYAALVKLGVIEDKELPLLDAWLADLASAQASSLETAGAGGAS